MISLQLGATCAQAKTLAISPLKEIVQTQFGLQCAHEVYLHMLKSQKYRVLPDWFVTRQLLTVDWKNNWDQVFTSLPEADEVILLQTHSDSGELIAVWLQRGSSPQVIKTEVLAFQHRDPLLTCTEMSHVLTGSFKEPRYRNPALSATLSFIVPGAGHFYQGTPESVALGSGFLLTYLLFGGLGFSNLTEPHVTRSQWGGILLLLTLTDIVTAYFMANQEP